MRLLLILLLLLALALPALLVGFARVVNQLTRSARERAVRRTFAGRALFLWRHRGRWEALVQESVLPALPAGVEPCPRDHERPEARALSTTMLGPPPRLAGPTLCRGGRLRRHCGGSVVMAAPVGASPDGRSGGPTLALGPSLRERGTDNPLQRQRYTEGDDDGQGSSEQGHEQQAEAHGQAEGREEGREAPEKERRLRLGFLCAAFAGGGGKVLHGSAEPMARPGGGEMSEATGRAVIPGLEEE